MGNKLIDYLMIDHDTAYHNALQAFKGHNLRELEQALHILYNKGYEDGVQATNVDCGVVWEERIDAIKDEIDNQYKWLMQTKHTLYDIDIAFDAIKRSIDKHCGGDTE